MNRFNTQSLLTLGMALTADRRTMERRVRGVFARRRSAKGVLILSIVLALALGFAAFTTACQPGWVTASDGNALVSGGDATVSGGDAIASGGNATQASAKHTKENAMEILKNDLERARKFPAPRMESIAHNERGIWEIEPNPDNTDRLAAANRFLEIANQLFTKAYTPDELTTTYYIDQTGFRADVWRFDSNDGVLSGAVTAKDFTFLSADCLNEPADALHPSELDGGKLDASATAARIATVLGGTAGEPDWRGGYSTDHPTAGWMIKNEVLIPLVDGRYCSINIFGDVDHTPTTVCLYPDEDCASEGVYWRADLEYAEDTTRLLFPQNFVKGEPGPEDMPVQEAYDFFYKLFDAAGHTYFAANEKPKEPNATFYLDKSGARENYWHIENNNVSFDLTSKTKRMLSLKANGYLGNKMDLQAIPYEKMGEAEYVEATRKLFTALYGEGAVKSVETNAVYDFHYCTVDPVMSDGMMYEIMYQDGLIVEADSYYKIDPNTWPSVPEWLKKWTTIDPATGEISIQGFENGTWKIVPNWLADWVYVNNETGEIFAMEW
jgi:hypothetical protein